MEDEVNSSSSVNFDDFADESLEMKIKRMLKWPKRDWQRSGLENTRIHRLCNSLRFWKAKLKPAAVGNALIVTLFNENRDVRLDLVSLIYAIEKLHPDIKVSGYSEFQNPRYLCFYFKDKEKRDYIKANFKIFEDNEVVCLSWALEESLVVIKVHWLPLVLDLEFIKTEVEKYASIIEEERHFLKMLDAREIPAGRMTFKVKMKPNISIESVPHLAQIGGMDALITIQGRQPMCINCNEMGHIARKCKMKFCTRCRSFVAKSHLCVEVLGPSYAEIAKGLPALDPDACHSDNEEEQPIEVDRNICPKFVDLAEKISKLESEVLAQADSIGVTTRLQKRKKTVGDADQGSEVESKQPALGMLSAAVPPLISGVVDTFQLADSNLKSVRDPSSFEGPSSLENKVKKQNRLTYSRSSNKKSDYNKAQKLFDAANPLDDFVFKD